jgi:RHS repeat-associated protein
MTNHLGNVLTVIHDIKIPLNNGSGPAVSSYRVGIRNSTDYSPFGVELDGRTVSLEGYRFGYQGSEKDNEFKGEGNSYTTEFRQLDPRLGRWLSVDPLFAKFPWQSSYCAFNNCPILLCDPLGLEAEGGPDDDKNGNEITRKVQESREVVVKGYPTKEQKRRRFWNRVWGGVNTFFGAMEASIGSGLIASGVGTPLGVIMLLHGVDHAAAGISQMTSGKQTDNYTYKEIKKIAKAGGASNQMAENIATFADASISIAGAGLASSVSRSLTRSAPKIMVEASEGVIKSYDDFVKEAQKLYPNKSGKIELHHITPKYLGGAKNGAVIPLDASYHQVITNEFRSLWPYGNGIPSATELENIMNQVYSKYPLPQVPY